jgi:protein ImuB
MAFACVYIPDFMVQSVARGEPALRDGALALIDGTPPLWSVVAANPAAFEAGIQLGMTKPQAAQFCGVQICHRSESQEKAAHVALLEAGWSVSPRVEDTAPDTMVLDLDGLTSLSGSEENIARELARRVLRIGLAPRVAVACNIEAAIHAARGFPGITMIAAGEERQRLGSLPVQVLAADPDVLEIPERWGVNTLQALAALPVLQLSERLGQEGVRLHELACGSRQRALVLAQPPSFFEEEMELDDAVEELEPLSFLLGRLLDQLCARLEAYALAVRAVRMRFELEPSFEKDFQSVKEGSRKKAAAKLYTKILSLPVPMRDSKMLLKLLRLQLQGDPPPAPIQKITLAVDCASPRVAQGGLFVPCAPDPEKLELTLARLAKLVGDANVGAVELLDTHRPENFRVTRFSAPTDREKTTVSRARGLQAGGENSAPAASRTCAGFRALRPPAPVKVELHEEQPVRVSMRGVRGEVVAASGPWRSSGDWWQEDAWQQEEWEVAIAFGRVDRRGEGSANAWPEYGVYCIYYDALRQGWFMRGVYD